MADAAREEQKARAETRKGTGRRITGAAIVVLVGVTVVSVVTGWDTARALQWGILAAALLALVIGVGLVANGHVLGALIDSRNRMSLARLQIGLWTILAVSAWLTVAVVRVPSGALDLDNDRWASGAPAAYATGEADCRAQVMQEAAESSEADLESDPTAKAAAEAAANERCVTDPLNISFPAELWWALGIATTSLAGSSLVKTYKSRQDLDVTQFDARIQQLGEAAGDADEGEEQQRALEAQKAEVQRTSVGALAVNAHPVDARFSDMFLGDGAASKNRVDLSKVQMFVFTVGLVLAYAVMVSTLLANRVQIFAPLGVDLPAFTNSMNVLLAISHAGYLTVKGAPEPPVNPEDPTGEPE